MSDPSVPVKFDGDISYIFTLIRGNIIHFPFLTKCLFIA